MGARRAESRCGRFGLGRPGRRFRHSLVGGGVRRPAVEPAWEAYSEGEIIARLGAALGLDGFDGRFDVWEVGKALSIPERRGPSTKGSARKKSALLALSVRSRARSAHVCASPSAPAMPLAAVAIKSIAGIALGCLAARLAQCRACS